MHSTRPHDNQLKTKTKLKLVVKLYGSIAVEISDIGRLLAVEICDISAAKRVPISIAQQINGSCVTRTAAVPQYLCSEL